MYQPKKYKNDSPGFIHRFIKENPFATVVVKGNFLLATHIPVLIEESAEGFRLYAHIANHNPMREHLSDGEEMLLIFKGPDAYISSGWYSEPEIPTWDYTAVHVNARLTLQSDSELQSSLIKLIDHFEKDKKNPIDFRYVPDEIWKENFKDITGFWLDPFKMTGIEKLHQGFEKKDIHNITKELKQGSECPMKIVDLLNKKHDIPN